MPRRSRRSGSPAAPRRRMSEPTTAETADRSALDAMKSTAAASLTLSYLGVLAWRIHASARSDPDEAYRDSTTMLSACFGVIATVLWLCYRKLRYRVPLRFQLLHTLAEATFFLCGMVGPSKVWRSVLGSDGRQLFELVKSIVSCAAKTGDWGGVNSVDVHIPTASGRAMRCRVYTPNGDGGKLPVCVWFHGGGWTISHYDDMEYDTICRRLAREGRWLVLSPEYRLAPEHPFPAAVFDAYACAVWAAEGSHPLFKIADKKGIIVGGDSAGGNLAAVVALLARAGEDVEGRRRELAVIHQLLVYPGLSPAAAAGFPSRHRNSSQWLIPTHVTDFMVGCYMGVDEAVRQRLKHDFRANPMAASSLDGVAAATVVIAAHDPLMDENIEYVRRLREAGVPATQLLYDDMPHGFFCPNLLECLHVPATMKAVKEAVASVRNAL